MQKKKDCARSENELLGWAEEGTLPSNLSCIEFVRNSFGGVCNVGDVKEEDYVR